MRVILGQGRRAFGNRLTLSVVLSVTAGEADPVVRAHLFRDPGAQLALGRGGRRGLAVLAAGGVDGDPFAVFLKSVPYGAFELPFDGEIRRRRT